MAVFTECVVTFPRNRRSIHNSARVGESEPCGNVPIEPRQGASAGVCVGRWPTTDDVEDKRGLKGNPLLVRYGSASGDAKLRFVRRLVLVDINLMRGFTRKNMLQAGWGELVLPMDLQDSRRFGRMVH